MTSRLRATVIAVIVTAAFSGVSCGPGLDARLKRASAEELMALLGSNEIPMVDAVANELLRRNRADLMVKAARSDKENLRIAAGRFISSFGEDVARPELRRLVFDDSRYVRIVSVANLRGISNAEDLEILREIAKSDSDGRVRQLAGEALEGR